MVGVSGPVELVVGMVGVSVGGPVELVVGLVGGSAELIMGMVGGSGHTCHSHPMRSCCPLPRRPSRLFEPVHSSCPTSLATPVVGFRLTTAAVSPTVASSLLIFFRCIANLAYAHILHCSKAGLGAAADRDAVHNVGVLL